ncbi:hypothetical protein BH11GEM1_BH11GEM1_16910 [soil metagenome]
MTQPAYSLAPSASEIVCAFYARHAPEGGSHPEEARALIPGADTVVAMVDAAFWASLRREEGHPPLISLAYVPSDRAGEPLRFATPITLAPDALARLSPAVERPGVHLGVWHDHAGNLRVWGATRTLPELAFVIEVVEPGLLVLKYRRGAALGKFGNMAVLRADHLRVMDERSAYQPDCPTLLGALYAALLDLDADREKADAGSALLKLAVSMRGHGRGGALLVVPSGRAAWMESIVQPMSYAIAPPFARLADLLRLPMDKRGRAGGPDGIGRLIDSVAGLTAVDGAAVINDRYEVLAFGAKIGRRDGLGAVEQVLVMEPVLGDVPSHVAPVQLGGTRHLSAAQFVHDQRDAVALVASQDGRFTVFAWSVEDALVHAHRIETLLF